MTLREMKSYARGTQMVLPLSADVNNEANENHRFRAAEDFQGVRVRVLDIPETIPKLGYATHQFFRYYGKFPSIVGREIIREFATPGHGVLDCYAGSGTTLVEAQIAGYSSFGIDINPIAVFASNVKTHPYGTDNLYRAYLEFQARIRRLHEESATPEPISKKMAKWFTWSAYRDLWVLKKALQAMQCGPERDLLTLTFLAIVRRVSNAFDGEVRPHINPGKRPRAPFEAFHDKYNDMVSGLRELEPMIQYPRMRSKSVIGDNRDPGSYSFLANEQIGLLVAHPPYLNSFNYLQVYGLEFYWSQGFTEVWQGWNERQIKLLEHRAWPATNGDVLKSYYENFYLAIEAASSTLALDGVLALVIGDATIRGQLEPVHKIIMDGLRAKGFAPIEVWYRTTHYGVGKYAYRHRADYHGEAEKKDAIMFFRNRG
jgi:hypothetical protein